MSATTTALAGIVSAGTYFSGSGAGLSSNTVPRASVANGTASHVVINSAGGALSSEATLALSRGGTNAALTSDVSLVKGIILAAGATAASTMTITEGNTVSSIVQRDSNGDSQFNTIYNIGASKQTLATTTVNRTATLDSYVSTTTGTSDYILQITTSVGFAGIIRAFICVADAAASSHYGVFDVVWRWKRTAGGLELNTTPTTKAIDRSSQSADYDVTITNSGTDVRVMVAHGAVVAGTLYWNGRFEVVRVKLS